jgi:hypothetical protein
MATSEPVPGALVADLNDHSRHREPPIEIGRKLAVLGRNADPGNGPPLWSGLQGLAQRNALRCPTCTWRRGITSVGGR